MPHLEGAVPTVGTPSIQSARILQNRDTERVVYSL
jgi:hypothetical protein